mmetsp:Transcript_9165/g.20612  ORF Transcript_9165/g.20612 Transcript_9165/m.20612 type:complete len:219 (-) Transcript_9165:917-1573(-)
MHVWCRLHLRRFHLADLPGPQSKDLGSSAFSSIRSCRLHRPRPTVSLLDAYDGTVSRFRRCMVGYWLQSPSRPDGLVAVPQRNVLVPHRHARIPQSQGRVGGCQGHVMACPPGVVAVLALCALHLLLACGAFGSEIALGGCNGDRMGHHTVACRQSGRETRGGGCSCRRVVRCGSHSRHRALAADDTGGSHVRRSGRVEVQRRRRLLVVRGCTRRRSW